MFIDYEGAKFNVGLKSSIEVDLIKSSIKRKIGRWIGKPYRPDPFLRYAKHLLSSGESGVVVDVGSNIGTTVLPLALKFPKTQFYALEPHPVPGSRFLKNCIRNKSENIELISVAISEDESIATIHTCPTNSGGHRLSGFKGRANIDPSKTGAIRIPTKPLSTIFQESNIDYCTLLKIDTEGHEVVVLESLGEYLRPEIVRHAVVEYGPEGLRQMGKTGWDLVSLMLERGYQCQVLGSEALVEREEDVPYVADFSVTDFVFSPRG